ncbi:glycosyltransferase [Streptomyces sp. 8N616]|uniref:glycosyltransferase n=1 Tax=Streptomyces sp. 8N616 TaxID=3457414 RepID=UPI003FD2A0F4
MAEFANALRDLQRAGLWDGKQPIRLNSCWTGSGRNSFAEQLAIELGVEVVAPTQPVWTPALGGPGEPVSVVSEQGLDAQGRPTGRPKDEATGQWVRFTPEKTDSGTRITRKEMGSTFPPPSHTGPHTQAVNTPVGAGAGAGADADADAGALGSWAGDTHTQSGETGSAHAAAEQAPMHELARHDGPLTEVQQESVKSGLVDFLNAGQRSAAGILVKMLQDRAEHLQGTDHHAEAVGLHDWANRQVETFVEGGLLGGRQKSVPKTVHFVWLGKPLADAALANLGAWAGRAKAAGWDVQMWTDTTRPPGQGPVSTWKPEVKKALEEAGVTFKEVTTLLPPKHPGPSSSIVGQLFGGGRDKAPQTALNDPALAKLRDIYEKARTNPEAFPMASDVIRYGILKEHGGVYADLDIGPGNVDLPWTASKMGHEDVSILGPMIRDNSALSKDKQELAGILGKPADQVTLEDVARHHLEKASYGNHFFAAPPGSTFIDHLIDAIPSAATEMAADEMGGTGAALTGPSGALAKALARHIGEFGLGETTAREEAAALDPKGVSQWAPLEWITHESDNQEYEAKPMHSWGPSPSSQPDPASTAPQPDPVSSDASATGPPPNTNVEDHGLLQDYRSETQGPEVRALLDELLAHSGNVSFERSEGSTGGNTRYLGDGQYVISYARPAGMSQDDHVAVLAHEMTHVAINEAYGSDMLNYPVPALTDAERKTVLEETPGREEDIQNARLDKVDRGQRNDFIDLVVKNVVSLVSHLPKSGLSAERQEAIRTKLVNHTAQRPYHEYDAVLSHLLTWADRGGADRSSEFYRSLADMVAETAGWRSNGAVTVPKAPTNSAPAAAPPAGGSKKKGRSLWLPWGGTSDQLTSEHPAGAGPGHTSPDAPGAASPSGTGPAHHAAGITEGRGDHSADVGDSHAPGIQQAPPSGPVLTDEQITAIYDTQMSVTDQLQSQVRAAGTDPVTDTMSSGDGSTRADVHHFDNDPDWSLKETAIRGALDKVAAAGYRLPGQLEITVAPPGAGVATQVTHLRDPDGSPHWHMFLGPRLFSRNDMRADSDKAVRGGMGPKGPRGVANRVADRRESNSFLRNVGLGGLSKTPRAHDVTLAEATVVHEYGHAMHTAHDATQFLRMQHAKKSGTEAEGTSVESSLDVSHYAANNGLEFVAEVFTALVYGEQLSEAALADYEAWGGPSQSSTSSGPAMHAWGDPDSSAAADDAALSAPVLDSQGIKERLNEQTQVADSQDQFAAHLGRDPFGVRTAPDAPDFLKPDGKAYDFGGVHADKRAALFEKLDLTRSMPTAAELRPDHLASCSPEKLSTGTNVPASAGWGSKQQKIPHVVHSIWMGGPLYSDGGPDGSGARQDFMDNIGKAASHPKFKGSFDFVVWTDVSRADFARVKDVPRGRLEGRDKKIAEMLDWAKAKDIRLVNLDEVFSRQTPMQLDAPVRTERGRGTGTGYAVASDMVRVEILHRFGGIYTDGDNHLVIEKNGEDVTTGALADYVGKVANDKLGFSLSVDPELKKLSNAAMVSAAGRPVTQEYRDILEANYAKDLGNLLAPGAEGKPLENLVAGYSNTKQETIRRTGPYGGTFEELAKKLNIPESSYDRTHRGNLPKLDSDVMIVKSAQSWLDESERTGEAARSGGEPTTVAPVDAETVVNTTKAAVVNLHRELANRPGVAYLPAADQVIKKLPVSDRPAAWSAGLDTFHATLGPDADKIQKISSSGIKLAPEVAFHAKDIFPKATFVPARDETSLGFVTDFRDEMQEVLDTRFPSRQEDQAAPMHAWGDPGAPADRAPAPPSGPVLTDEQITEIYDTQKSVTDQLQSNVRAAGTAAPITTTMSASSGSATADVHHFGSDPDWALKEAAIQGALNKVAAAGYQLPGRLEITVSPPGANGVATQVTHLRDPDGSRHWHMFLGPRLFTRNDMSPGTDSQVRGGTGRMGPRGVANRVADSRVNNSVLRRAGLSSLSKTPRAHDVAVAEATVVHELGHAMHTAHNPEQFLRMQHHSKTGTPAPGTSVASAPDVSHYAVNNGLEFVAEAFTALVYGEQLSDAALADYVKWGGPYGKGDGPSHSPSQQPAGHVGGSDTAGTDDGRSPGERSGGKTPELVGPVADPVRPGQWTHRAAGAPVAPLRTERFDPRTDPMSADRRPGFLDGWATLIRTGISRVQADDGRWVRNLSVNLPVRFGEGFTATNLADFEARAQGLLDDHVNTGFQLPKSKDQLHVDVKFTVDPGHSEAVELSMSANPGRSDQLHFDLHGSDADAATRKSDDAVVLHELLHYLGLSDRYQDADSLFRNNPGKADRTGLMADVSRLPGNRMPSRYLTEIETATDSGPVVHDHPLSEGAAATPGPVTAEAGNRLTPDDGPVPHDPAQAPRRVPPPSGPQPQQQATTSPTPGPTPSLTPGPTPSAVETVEAVEQARLRHGEAKAALERVRAEVESARSGDRAADPGTHAALVEKLNSAQEDVAQAESALQSAEAAAARTPETPRPLGTSHIQGLKTLIPDWPTKSAVPGFRRSPELQAIDRALKTWHEDGAQLPGLLDKNERQLQDVKKAIENWHRAKEPRISRRADAIGQLQEQVEGAIEEFQEKRRERERQDELRGTFEKMHPELKAYASRVRADKVNPDENSVHHAMTIDRDEAGRLTEESLRILDELARGRLDDQRRLVGKVKTAQGVTSDGVRQMMEQHVNPVTGKTVYPELASFLSSQSTSADLVLDQNQEQTTEKVGDTAITVHSDVTDSLREERIGQLKEAVKKVQDAGYAVPDLTAYLPKYGRNLELSVDGRVAVAPGPKIARAEYIAPGSVITSPEGIGNPLGDKIADQYRFLSTELDADGTGTMVHELGHFLHYCQSRGKYHDLSYTEFASGPAKAQSLASSVSGYAAGNAREFVAEVFLGLVYGKQYDQKVMDMYKALGGPSAQR